MPFIHVLVVIVASLLGILPIQALAKDSCKEVGLHTDKAILSGQTTGSETDFTCFQLLVEQGMTLRLKIVHASNNDMAFNIRDVVDNQDDYTLLTKRDSYRVDGYNTFGASRPGPFRVLASVVKPAAKGGHLVVPQKDATGASANDQPLGIIHKMYSDLFTNNYTNAINSKKNRSRYFAPALVRLYAADDERACVAGIEASGQEINAAQIRKTLSIVQTSNDGTQAEVVSRVENGGQLESFRYEFLKQGNTWKISDVVYPNGDRFSHMDCWSR